MRAGISGSPFRALADRRTRSADALGTPGLGAGHPPCISRRTGRNRRRRGHTFGAFIRSARHVPHRGRRFRGPRPVRHALDGRHTARNRERRIRRHSPASRLRHALGALSRLARGPPLIGRRGGRNRR
ncbi:hypothetical protein GCM10010287_49800 [Streptomyces variabilis]|uniref:Uncharacterized protein n=1 Tax=Streptomyces variabilis TaxID=67372 RepID=A0ABQ2U5U0_9ACTN|nr:hypothetical protein GCM10010265_56360 [Streptomyces griseoincarnatus]GGT69158.1 hypothetical protein GCM10010287_49800 [Streptomyces variabilis]